MDTDDGEPKIHNPTISANGAAGPSEPGQTQSVRGCNYGIRTLAAEEEDLQKHGRITGHSIIDGQSVLEENGRLYQAYRAGKYILPNDGEEQVSHWSTRCFRPSH
jgi:hypothetical protein